MAPNVTTEIFMGYGFQYPVQQHVVRLLNHFHFIVKFTSRLWLLFLRVCRSLTDAHDYLTTEWFQTFCNLVVPCLQTRLCSG